VTSGGSSVVWGEWKEEAAGVGSRGGSNDGGSGLVFVLDFVRFVFRVSHVVGFIALGFLSVEIVHSSISSLMCRRRRPVGSEDWVPKKERNQGRPGCRRAEVIMSSYHRWGKSTLKLPLLPLFNPFWGVPSSHTSIGSFYKWGERFR